MHGFVRKAFVRTLPAVAAFALVGPLIQGLQRTIAPHHAKGDPFEFPFLLLIPAAGVFLGASAFADEREGGGLEFALSLPLTGRGLLARLLLAGALPFALLFALIVFESQWLAATPRTLLAWGGPADLAALFIWPYVAGFYSAIIAERFATALAFAFVLMTGAETLAAFPHLSFAPRWFLMALFLLSFADRLFAPPGILEPRARTMRTVVAITGFILLALALGRPALIIEIG